MLLDSIVTNTTLQYLRIRSNIKELVRKKSGTPNYVTVVIKRDLTSYKNFTYRRRICVFMYIYVSYYDPETNGSLYKAFRCR